MSDEPSVVAFPPPPASPEAEVEALRAEVARLTHRLAEMERLADLDPLSPVLNRRAFVRELGRALALQTRYGEAAALVYFDIEGLRAVNAAHGHEAGDAAVAAVARTLAEGTRESDLLGRVGGDEFALLLVRASAVDARAKAQLLAATVAARPLAHAGRSIPLAVSFGVAPLERGLDAAAALAAADAAMYLARASRR